MKFLIYIFLICTTAWAGENGGWIGMGGELFKDARNPWFVKNTNEVLYCIDIDKKNISATPQEITQAFQEALQFWKSEFSRSNDMQDGHFSLGTQTFTQVSCDQTSIDYRILFGSSLLNKNELDFLKDPTQYVGVTVRTNYDPINLKGKGFSFFADDLNIKTTNSFLPKAWSHPKVLRYAFMHELGHVFGLPHFGTGLMSEIFLDQLIKPEYLYYYEQLPFESIVQPDTDIKICTGLSNIAKQFLAIPADHQCVQLQTETFNKKKVVSYKESNSVEFNLLGTLILQSPNLDDIAARPISFLQLTNEQQVFTAKERQFRLFMLGPMANELSQKGKFIPNPQGPPKNVYFKISPNNMTLLGVTPNGEINTIFNHASLLGLIYTLPPHFFKGAL